MNIRNHRREDAIERMADHVLRVGFAGATLRPLAAAAGTSDRMLLYYFADKDELLTAVLDRIAARLLGELDKAVAVGPRPFAVLLDQVWKILGSPTFKSYMNIWLELASSAARDLQPFRNVAGAIADGYLGWVADRLEPPRKGAAPVSELFLATLQGMFVLNAIGRPAIAKTAMIDIGAGLSTAATRPSGASRKAD